GLYGVVVPLSRASRFRKWWPVARPEHVMPAKQNAERTPDPNCPRRAMGRFPPMRLRARGNDGQLTLLRGLLAHLGRAPFQPRLARGPGLVEAAAGGEAGRLLETADVAGLGGLGEGAQSGDELIEALPRLRFRGLHQHRAVHDEREVHGHGVIALV